MPKAPILSRETYYDTLNNGTLHLLDWNVVNTSLGAMVEPRQVSLAELGTGDQAQIDLTDVGPTRLSPMVEDTFFGKHLGGGQQLPRDYN
jgi:hypothetical protein